MSEQRISQRSSSDFSIARILSNDLSPNLKKKCKVSEEFSINKDKFREERSEGRESRRETLERKREDDKFKEMKKLQPGSVNLNSENLGDLKEDEEQDQRSEILNRELPWLRCTRYSPPKLPRRPSTGKQTKRRLGSHPRIPFTKLQIQVLEEKYNISAYLSRRDVTQLAGTLNLPQNRVKIWFQNRRARERKESQSHNLGLSS